MVKVLKKEDIITETESAVAIIRNPEGKILLTKRIGQPFDGCYGLVGGKREPNETAEKNCTREVKEEVRLDVDLEWNLGVYDEKGVLKGLNDKGVVEDVTCTYHCTAFIANIDSNPFQKVVMQNSEVADYIWVDPLEARKMQLAFSANQIIDDYLDWLLGS